MRHNQHVFNLKPNYYHGRSGISDTESEGGNVSDRGYTSDNDVAPPVADVANINMVSAIWPRVFSPATYY